MRQEDIVGAQNKPIVRSLLTLDAVLESALIDERKIVAVKAMLTEQTEINPDLGVFLDDTLDLSDYFKQFVVGDVRLERAERFLVALIEGNSDRTLQDDCIYFLLQNAVFLGNINIVRLLLADPHVDFAYRRNLAIRWASSNGHVDVVNLLQADPRVNSGDENNAAIRLASENGHVNVVYLLLSDPGVDLGDLDDLGICGASENGHVDIVRLLLADPRIKYGDDNNVAIRLASENGHIDVVRLLLADPRVHPAAHNNWAIHWAFNNEHIDVVRLLLSDERVSECLGDDVRRRYSISRRS